MYVILTQLHGGPIARSLGRRYGFPAAGVAVVLVQPPQRTLNSCRPPPQHNELVVQVALPMSVDKTQLPKF